MSGLRRGLILSAAAATSVLALAVPAWAHVTVNPNEATQGGFAKLSFRVPTESDTASTTKLEVAFPTDEPLAFVSVRPHAGWSYKVDKTKLATPISSDDGQVTEAVSKITWTANTPADGIKPGEFDEFDVSVGPLPESDSMVFKAIQTYSDGEVVRWIEEPTTGGSEPEHPAPTLHLTPGSDLDPGAADTPASATDDGGSDKTPLVLSVIALVISLAAGAATVLGRRRA